MEDGLRSRDARGAEADDSIVPLRSQDVLKPEVVSASIPGASRRLAPPEAGQNDTAVSEAEPELKVRSGARGASLAVNRVLDLALRLTAIALLLRPMGPWY